MDLEYIFPTEDFKPGSSYSTRRVIIMVNLKKEKGLDFHFFLSRRKKKKRLLYTFS